MQSTFALREAMAKLLAANAATLAPVTDANLMTLAMANFTPGENLAIGGLVAATFDGSDPLEIPVGAVPEGVDPNTGDAIITLPPPAGGFRWETTGTTSLPQTIYGYYVTNNAGDLLLCSEKLPVPIVLTAINQVIEIGPATLRLPAGSLK